MSLTTARLVLRAARPNDLMALYEIFRDPSVMQYWSTAPHASPAVTKVVLDRWIANAKVRLVYFVIEMDGRVIGGAGMPHDFEVGFIMHPAYWRQGIVTEAMRAIIPHIFAVTDAPVLTADVDPANTASAKCLRKLDFALTHSAKNTFLINDVWYDSDYYALPRPV